MCALAMSFMFPIASFTAKAPLGIPVSGELNLIAKENPSLMNDILNGNAVTMGQKDYIKVWPMTVATSSTRTVLHRCAWWLLQFCWE